MLIEKDLKICWMFKPEIAFHSCFSDQEFYYHIILLLDFNVSFDVL